MAEIKAGKSRLFLLFLPKIAAEKIYFSLCKINEKNAPRQYEAGTKKARNIRAIHGDKYKTRKTPRK